MLTLQCCVRFCCVYVYVYVSPVFFGFPSLLGHHRALSSQCFSLIIYIIHSISSVYMSIPISHFFSLVKRGVNHGSGHSKREGGGGFFTSNGSGSTLIKMLDLLFNSDFVLWLKMIVEEFMIQEWTDKLIMCLIFHGIIILNIHMLKKEGKYANLLGLP